MGLAFFREFPTRSVHRTAADAFRVAEAGYAVAAFRASVIVDDFCTLEGAGDGP